MNSAAARRPGDRPAVSVVVACYLRHDGLRRLLGALERQTFDDFEVVVVDQVGDGTIREMVDLSPLEACVVEAIPAAGTWVKRRLADRVRRGGTRAPSNASRARNTGALRARADVILFTDDDCVPEPNWVEGMSAPLRDDSSVVAVAGANRVLTGAAAEPALARFSGRRRPNLFAGQGGSSNLAVRHADFFAVGGFDTSIGPGTKVFGAEDQHLIWRLLLRAEDRGGAVVGCRNAAVVDRDVTGRWAPLRQRWIYMSSFGRMMRRERLRNDEPAAGAVVADLIVRDTPRGIRRAVGAAQPGVVLQGLVTETALVWGWIRGRHLQAFVPETGTGAELEAEQEASGT